MKVICIIILSVMIMSVTGCNKKENTIEPTSQHSIDIEQTKDVVAGGESQKETEGKSQASVESQSKESEGVTSQSQQVEDTKVQSESVTDETTASQTQPQTQQPTKAPNEPVTEKPTEKPTERPTQAPTQKPTESPTQAPTQAPTETPTEFPELPTYDIYSREYATQVEELTFKYINQFRVEEGKFELKQMSNPLGIQFAYGRAEQLYTNFNHDTDMIRELSTKLKYGIYVCYETHRCEGEPYYEPYGTEAIAKNFVSEYVSPDALAQKIAGGFRKSPGHWAYVGCADEGFSDLTRVKYATYVKGEYAYTCAYMIDEKNN